VVDLARKKSITREEDPVNTSYYRDVGVWLDTEDRQHEATPRESNVTTRSDLRASARWNLGVLTATALASTVFFLTPLLTVPRPDPPAPAPRPALLAQAAAPLVLSVTNDAPPQAARRNRRYVKRPASRQPSRLARLFLGDGSVEVRPFPTLEK
jgi:hypothetical protein